MANLIRETQTLKLDALFVDGDTRTITLKNPKETITTAQITTLNTLIQSGNLLIGDKAGGTFGRIDKVRRVTETKVLLDLTGG